jgi:hypothetical protein
MKSESVKDRREEQRNSANDGMSADDYCDDAGNRPNPSADRGPAQMLISVVPNSHKQCLGLTMIRRIFAIKGEHFFVYSVAQLN